MAKKKFITMSEYDAIQLGWSVIASAILAGVIFGFIIWFFAKPDKK